VVVTTNKGATMNNKLTAGDSVNFAEPKSNVTLLNDYCVQCGRKVGNLPWRVEIINGGDIAENPGQNDTTDAGYMGTFAVGNECAKSFDQKVLFRQHWVSSSK